MSEYDYHLRRPKKQDGFDIFFSIVGGLIVLVVICFVLFAAHGIGTYSGRAEVYEEAVKRGYGKWIIVEPTASRQSRRIMFEWIEKPKEIEQ